MPFNAPPNVPVMLNQQYMQASGLVQQATMWEASGNLPAAGQCFEQAAGLVGNTIQTAQQWAMPIPDAVFFGCAYAHFGAARIAAMMGAWQVAPMHLAQAQFAVNQAINVNPNVFYYHSAAGMVMLAQGNLPEADRAFNTALRLNPSDPWSRYMLAMLHTAQGNPAAGDQHLNAALTVAPALPPVQHMLPQGIVTPGAAGQSAQPRWMDILTKVATIADAVNKIGGAVNTMSGLMGQFQHSAPMGWNPGGGGW